MKNHIVSRVVLASAILALASVVHAAPFEELFRIVTVAGECTVQAPDSSEFIAAEEGKAYPYGTRIRTGRKSSAVISFSEGNQCRVLAGANLALTRDAADPKLKTIKLNEGKVEIELEPNYKEKNKDTLNVETATAVCGAIGCKYSIDVRIEDELVVVVILCAEGSIDVWGPHFKNVVLNGDEGISISSAKDKTFIRIKNIKGSFTIQIRNADGTERIVELKLGAVIKIWRSRSADGKSIIVTILITSPDGTLEEAITYNEEITDETEDLGEGDGDQGDEGDDDDDDQGIDEDMEPMPGASSTTTTTIPSPTPVGRR